MNTISDLAYDRSGAPNCVYVLERNRYIPFLVLTDNYNGNTLLLRRDPEEEPRRINDYDSYYGKSEIDAYLSNEYINGLSEILPYIIDSPIVITSGESLGRSGTGTETIDRSVFLLSCTELGINDRVNIAAEGKALKYFKDQNNRFAYVNGKPYSWWLRTPNPYYLSCTYVIGDNNKIGFTNAFDKNGIRPAFCVKSDTRIKRRSGIVDGQNVYVFSFEK